MHNKHTLCKGVSLVELAQAALASPKPNNGLCGVTLELLVPWDTPL